MAASNPIKNVIVLGATGSVGPAVVDALLSSKFHISIYTRSQSKKQPPDSVTVYRGDYDESSLLRAFEGQDAIVSAISTFSTAQQKQIIDVAIRAGIRRYLPSEFGMDTGNPDLEKLLPGAVTFKQDIVKYLKTKEHTLSWSASKSHYPSVATAPTSRHPVIVGAFLDWSLHIPGLLGIDIPNRKATIFDAGNARFEATNLAQIGRAVAASLEHHEETANRYVYVNSLTVTQNEIVAELEKVTGDKFAITHVESESVVAEANEKVRESIQNNDYDEVAGGKYAKGFVELVQSVLVANYGGLNNFSKHGLWNARLGLPEENLGATIRKAVKQA